MVDNKNKHFLIDQYAVCDLGKDERTFPFIACSDSTFTEEELELYRSKMASKNLKMPTKSYLSDKCDDISKLLKREWTNEQFEYKLRTQRAREQAYADSMGLNGTNGTPTPKKVNSIQDRMAEINRQNRKKNQEEVRKAQLAARKAELAARKQAEAKYKRKLAEEKAAAEAAEKAKSLQVPGSDLDALFDGSDASRAATPKPDEKKIEKPKTEKKVGIPTFKKKAMDDDIIGSMDLGIDIEI